MERVVEPFQVETISGFDDTVKIKKLMANYRKAVRKAKEPERISKYYSAVPSDEYAEKIESMLFLQLLIGRQF